MSKKTLQDFAKVEAETLRIWGQVIEAANKFRAEYEGELRRNLAKKAIDGDTLSQYDRWQIAQLLTGEKYPAPKKRGGQADPDNDIRLFMELCDIAARLEGVEPNKLKEVALTELVERESNQRDRDGVDRTTIAKAVARGARELDLRRLQSDYESWSKLRN